MASKARAYAEKKGFVIAKMEGDNAILSKCPLCGAETMGQKRRFYIDVSGTEKDGLWCTYCCEKSGNLFTLKKALGDFDKSFAGVYGDKVDKTYRSEVMRMSENFNSFDKEYANINNGSDPSQKSVVEMATIEEWHRSLFVSDKNMEAVTSFRGFSRDALEKFKIGLRKIGGKEYLSIPIIYKGAVANVKLRSMPPAEKEFKRVPGAKTTLFNADDLKGNWQYCFITESETDAISLWQYGLSPVVSVTSGAQSAAKLIEKYRDLFVDYDEIFVVMDMDEKGQEAADAIASVLGRYRCRNVELPCKDANECLLEGISEDLIQARIGAARSFAQQRVKHISEMSDMVDRIFSTEEKMTGASTGYAELDLLVHGLRGGEITVITGDTGTGKSILANRLAMNVSSQGKPALLCSFELMLDDNIRRCVTMSAEKPLSRMDGGQVRDAFDNLCKLPLYVLDRHGRMPWDELSDCVEYGVRRHGLWLLVLDHLHFFIDEAEGFADDTVAINNTLRRIDDLSKTFGIHIVLVVHPKNLRRDRNGREIDVDMGDLKGSSEIKKISDRIFRVSRPRDGDRSDQGVPKAVFTLLKSRREESREGTVQMRYDPDALQYLRWTENDEEEDKKARRKKATGGVGSRKSEGAIVNVGGRDVRVGDEVGGDNPTGLKDSSDDEFMPTIRSKKEPVEDGELSDDDLEYWQK